MRIVASEGGMMLWYVLTSLVLGLLAAVAARAALPGRRPLTLRTATVLGMLGALVGGFVGQAALGDGLGAAEPDPAGVVGALAGAVTFLLAGWGIRLHRYRSGPRRAGSRRVGSVGAGSRR